MELTVPRKIYPFQTQINVLLIFYFYKKLGSAHSTKIFLILHQNFSVLYQMFLNWYLVFGCMNYGVGSTTATNLLLTCSTIFRKKIVVFGLNIKVYRMTQNVSPCSQHHCRKFTCAHNH